MVMRESGGVVVLRVLIALVLEQNDTHEPHPFELSFGCNATLP